MPSDDDAFVQGVVESGSNAIQDGFVALPDGGVMSGVEPPTPPAPLPTNQQNTFTTTTTNGEQQQRTFTAAEVEAARKQERDKLYDDLEKERQRRKELEKVERDRQKVEDEKQKQLEDEQRKAAEAEMDARQLIESRTAEFQAQLAEERQQREQLQAVLDQERRLTQLEQYRQGRMSQVQDEILPELIDMIGGSSEEEIDASIQSLQARTASILGNVQQTVATVRQGMQGASVTAPPVGPLEQQTQYQQLSPEDIRAMTPQEYAQHRERLLGAMRQQVTNQGIYGPRG